MTIKIADHWIGCETNLIPDMLEHLSIVVEYDELVIRIIRGSIKNKADISPFPRALIEVN